MGNPGCFFDMANDSKLAAKSVVEKSVAVSEKHPGSSPQSKTYRFTRALPSGPVILPGGKEIVFFRPRDPRTNEWAGWGWYETVDAGEAAAIRKYVEQNPHHYIQESV